jgi:hypothetical protein
MQSFESQPTFRRNTSQLANYAVIAEHAIRFQTGFLLGLFFNLEDGGGILLQNIGLLPTGNKTLFIYHKIELFINSRRKLQSSKRLCL